MSFSRAVFALGAVGVLIAGAISNPPQKKAPAQGASFAKSVKPFLAKHCVSCHSGKDGMANVDLDLLKTAADISKHRDLAERAVRMVTSGLMPPKGRPMPTAVEKREFASLIETTIAKECDIRDPGRVTMRRMNRLEYNHTIRDLVGLDLKLADDFPSDDVGYGFDNIGDVLSISPLLMEKYLKAAETIANKAIVLPETKPQKYDAGQIQGGGQAGDGEVTLMSNLDAFVDYTVQIPGDYKVKVGAFGDQAGPDVVRMAFKVNGKVLQTVEVKTVRGNPETFTFSTPLSVGKHRVGVAFTNDFYVGGKMPQDRNLYVKSLEIVRPAGEYATLPNVHRQLIPPAPAVGDRAKVAKVALGKFASRAFRRPATQVEVDRLVQICEMAWKNGESFERGMQLGIQATLSSPHFLFRVETENGSNQVGPYELATRLSYFLWGSMPDDRLFALAANKEILKPSVIQAEAKRMLKDPRASSLGEAFAAQWLNLRKLTTINIDTSNYKDFDEALRQSMMTETLMFFQSVVNEDRPLTDFIEGKYTYINEQLAKLYGIGGVTGNEFRKVSLDGTPRAGLITQAAVLTLTSNPTRTSPVKRGKWVLEQILNDPPPPPPPGVPDIKDDDPNAPEAKTIREKLERHLKDAVCASCHRRMDPLGFSLENFDAIGKWRTTDGKAPVDATGELPDGTKFTGPKELRTILMTKKEQFIRAMSEKMLTFATGRGMDASDKCNVDAAAKLVEKNGMRFSALVSAVVVSEPFRTRRPEKQK